jgi:hypothetical protein
VDRYNFTLDGPHLTGAGDKATGWQEAHVATSAIGIQLVNCHYVTITDADLSNHGRAAIVLKGCKHVRIQGGSIAGTIDSATGAWTVQELADGHEFGIWIGEGCEDVTVDGVDICGTAQGIYASRHCRDITIRACRIHDIPGQHGMYLCQCQGLTVGGGDASDANYVAHCNDHGIKLQMTGLDDSSATDVAIAGNTVRDVGGHAILLTYTGLTGPSTWIVSPSVTGNTCVPTQRSAGITLIGVKDPSVTYNHIVDAEYGIQFRGCQWTEQPLDQSGNTLDGSGIEVDQYPGPYAANVWSHLKTFDPGLIQALINRDDTISGDEIVLAPGYYYTRIDFNNKDITVRGTDPDDPAVVTGTVLYFCDYGDSGGQRVPVAFEGSETGDARLCGLTVTGGLEAGGIAGNGTGATIDRCIVRNNVGGGIVGFNGTIQNCTIAANPGSSCAGLINCGGTIRNCLVLNNGRGVDAPDGAVLTGCTIYHNTGCGLNVQADGTVNLTNCILWDNDSSGTQIALETGAAAAASYCDIQLPGTDVWPGDANINADPLFVNPVANDLHLACDSPCIQAGDPSFSPAAGETDMDGRARVVGDITDIGADEFWWAGDANYNGFVDVVDLLLLVDAFGSVLGDSNYDPNCDSNNDGSVDVVDLLTMVGNWGYALGSCPSLSRSSGTGTNSASTYMDAYEALESVGLLEVYLEYIAEHPEAGR